MIRAGIILASLLSSAAIAEEITLSIPLDCDVGQDCFIQHYPDQDPSAGVLDYRCGTVTYDGHTGTDFATLPGRPLNVHPAAHGRILAVRDGLPDSKQFGTAPDFPSGQDCGNGVVIQHSNTYQTQYCHLKNGSIRVEIGDMVTTDTILGQTGASGNAEFEHLHFTLRKDGRHIDPFAPNQAPNCLPTVHDDKGYWAQPIAYQHGGILEIGISDHVPDYNQITSGLASQDLMPPQAAALVIWTHLVAIQNGDQLKFELYTPQNQPIFQQDITIKANQDRGYRAAGLKRKPNAQWPKGTWTFSVEHRRDNKVVSQKIEHFEIN